MACCCVMLLFSVFRPLTSFWSCFFIISNFMTAFRFFSKFSSKVAAFSNSFFSKVSLWLIPLSTLSSESLYSFLYNSSFLSCALSNLLFTFCSTSYSDWIVFVFSRRMYSENSASLRALETECLCISARASAFTYWSHASLSTDFFLCF